MICIISAKEKKIIMIPGAGHLFEEPRSMAIVGKLAVDWFVNQM
jgi:hypothetical protein